MDIKVGDKLTSRTDGTKWTVVAVKEKTAKVRESDSGLTDWKALSEIGEGFKFTRANYESETLRLRNLTQTEDGRKLLAAIECARGGE